MYFSKGKVVVAFSFGVFFFLHINAISRETEEKGKMPSQAKNPREEHV